MLLDKVPCGEKEQASVIGISFQAIFPWLPFHGLAPRCHGFITTTSKGVKSKAKAKRQEWYCLNAYSLLYSFCIFCHVLDRTTLFF